MHVRLLASSAVQSRFLPARMKPGWGMPTLLLARPNLALTSVTLSACARYLSWLASCSTRVRGSMAATTSACEVAMHREVCIANSRCRDSCLSAASL